MKILNLYAGIGGNRKLWGDSHEITAIEYKQEIADIYHDFFPKDKIIVTDAHQYLLEHFKEFDFIWSSPPCPSHSRNRNVAGVGSGRTKPIYPDMKLYEEIVLLKHLSKLENNGFKGKYCIENVISYYEPIIKPQKIALHYYWANFLIRPYDIKTREHSSNIEILQNFKGFDLSKYKIDKRRTLRNCVEFELGKHILDCAMGIHPQKTLL